MNRNQRESDYEFLRAHKEMLLRLHKEYAHALKENLPLEPVKANYSKKALEIHDRYVYEIQGGLKRF